MKLKFTFLAGFALSPIFPVTQIVMHPVSKLTLFLLTDVTMSLTEFNPVDLQSCEKEPIHIPGKIQPHGVLFGLTEDDHRIIHVSSNVRSLIHESVDTILGRRFGETIPKLDPILVSMLGALESNTADPVTRTVVLPTNTVAVRYEASVHRSNDLLILELEEVDERAGNSIGELYPDLRTFVRRLQATKNLDELCAIATAEVRHITGFDRVMVYRFDEDWNGTVLGENRNEVLPSYFDLRFPASDIPAQARDLYRLNPVRIIPDAAYTPVPIEPPVTPSTNKPLDLSFASLRSVSPVHLEYMHNMGTMASMSISILQGERLWGLISCHSRQARRVPPQIRNACDFLTQIFALQAGALEQAAAAEHRMRLSSVQTRLLGHMAEENSFVKGLIEHPAELLELAGASGAAVVTEENVHLVGTTPLSSEVRQLSAWLSHNHSGDVFATNKLGAICDLACAKSESTAGLLAISVSKVYTGYIIWFRPEVVQMVSWGGDPSKAVTSENGETRLHPRKSFEIWRETVRGQSLPWSPYELEAVRELRNAVMGIVLRRAEELASLTVELQRSNKELEAFSYSVSHDLRAPFRHIVGYSEMLRNQEGQLLSERGRRYVDTIIEAAFSAGTLVDNLLSFSQMGRATLSLRKVDLNLMVEDVRRRLSTDIGDRQITWHIGHLGQISVDQVMFRLAIENLLSNAIKYTRMQDIAVIEIGRIEDGKESIFFVRDNGAGFDMAYSKKLFGVFQRLHRVDEFEGTGIGLANVRRIVERHSGRVWAEGALNQGATFYFAFPKQEIAQNG